MDRLRWAFALSFCALPCSAQSLKTSVSVPVEGPIPVAVAAPDLSVGPRVSLSPVVTVGLPAAALSPVPALKAVVAVPGQARALPAVASSRAALSRAAAPFRAENRAPALARPELTLNPLFDGAGRLAEPVDPPEAPGAGKENGLSKPSPAPSAQTPPQVPSPPSPAEPIQNQLWAKAKVAASVTFGLLLILIGLVMIPLPGPGSVLIILGLAILARHFRWAKTALKWVKLKAAAATRVARHKLRDWRRKRRKGQAPTEPPK